MEYTTLYKLHSDGKFEEISVLKEEIDRRIDRMLEKDKEMLEILAKL